MTCDLKTKVDAIMSAADALCAECCGDLCGDLLPTRSTLCGDGTGLIVETYDAVVSMVEQDAGGCAELTENVVRIADPRSWGCMSDAVLDGMAEWIEGISCGEKLYCSADLNYTATVDGFVGADCTLYNGTYPLTWQQANTGGGPLFGWSTDCWYGWHQAGPPEYSVLMQYTFTNGNPSWILRVGQSVAGQIGLTVDYILQRALANGRWNTDPTYAPYIYRSRSADWGVAGTCDTVPNFQLVAAS